MAWLWLFAKVVIGLVILDLVFVFLLYVANRKRGYMPGLEDIE